MTGKCDLCGREEELTRHHLVPRMLVRRRKKVPNKEEKAKPKVTVKICEPCHLNIHATFTEKQLAERYNTLAKLKKQEPIITFSKWIRSKPAGFKPKKRAKARNKS